MLPVIALVGRPNVGKSTLFNRLTRTRDALVADFPGLTRDRKYGQANYEGYEFIVVDTGGIDGSEEGIETEMAEQSLLAIEEADIVLFLVDARAGMTVADQAIAQHLRKQQKNCFVVANKTDGIDADSNCAEFYQLALGDVQQIAAAHGRGVTQLLELTLQPVIAELTAQDEELEHDDEDIAELYLEGEEAEDGKTGFEDKPVKLAIIGRPNVGKSTLTNRILGEDRVIVYDMPGTTRDSIYIPMTRNDKEYVLIDTAGVRKRKKVSDVVEKFSVIKTLQAIEDANVVLLVVDAREGISDQDLSLLGFALNAGRSLVIAVNKWDGLDDYVKERIKTELDRRLGFVDFARLHFISALHGTGVGHLFESIDEAYESATKRVSTAMLRRIMDMAQADHQPPLVRGRRVKLKYAHAGGYNPPRIVIHGNMVHELPDSYKRYLMNYYRKALNVMGTPIKIEFREGDNPYAGRSNKMTLSQKRKLRAFAKENRNKS
ncbi:MULTISPECIES: ribosome biogenesis GTPase Der [Pseudoalteromonas]|uniref:GTPase Der n=1 Tax=Pseudoalteromonas maricaloris TaxID=184924 RepID=A0A8I2H7F1_9GAMM|nr:MULTISPECIES: ribosome biogenesis GTPase Der [Pseudoalteromonas]KID36242.1 GTP-binding protein Der [Pseudoalteromonas flavipulchra NCIMB 2033 = ATCC BAA-314]KJZ05022.1 GTP-binding protein Der [Pseudoalteromonas piscicida]MBD0780412.1 ribosome biogenesis GTPase Der [Pseudoalteromonas flavipulchra]MBE0371688.1 GTP-binding protein [Pseudoalteromonas flavipulchra NCIMB 2033 = ATCC BAA-314]MCG7538845.1 ribosome biogenesis GTPase Der [Pseudoalteromonas sp. OF7H-1]